MAQIRAFRGFRPRPELAVQVASRPYDVINSAEARVEAEGNPLSFLHVVKPEIDLPEDIDPYSAAVYQKGRENFEQMLKDGILFQDEKPSLYVYQLVMDGRVQTGYVLEESIEDYFDGTIKKHELTRPVKEEDRKEHVRVSRIHAEPVFFAYPSHEELDAILAYVVQSERPTYDFQTEDGITHRLWVVQDERIINRVQVLFEPLDVYVADGHHRTAAAAMVGKELQQSREEHQGDEPYNYLMAVVFPDNQLTIIDYNRVIKDLNRHSEESFLLSLEQGFEVKRIGKEAHAPTDFHNFGMYLGGEWYSLTARTGTYNEQDPIGVLDVTILSAQVLEPLLGITDLRRDKRIDFVGGIRGLGELEKRVDSGEMKVAFALYPVSMQQLIDIADSGEIMPPKTTWFEPKLRSGLVVHSLD
ncbi:MAG: DUF1015 family protein [Bacteroidota bacterium]